MCPKRVVFLYSDHYSQVLVYTVDTVYLFAEGVIRSIGTAMTLLLAEKYWDAFVVIVNFNINV